MEEAKQTKPILTAVVRASLEAMHPVYWLYHEMAKEYGCFVLVAETYRWENNHYRTKKLAEVLDSQKAKTMHQALEQYGTYETASWRRAIDRHYMATGERL